MVPSSDMPARGQFAAAKQCVLVVEDEFFIRLIVSDNLRDAGYDVIEASNADEALTILASKAPIDLIVSDVRMPGSIDGLGLLAVVRETLPTLPVIVTSGHLDPRLAMCDGAAQFLAKPFGSGALVSAVRKELAPGHD